MRKRANRDLYLAMTFVELCGALALASVFVPSIRQALTGLGAILIVTLVVGTLLAIGFLIFTLIRRKQIASKYDYSEFSNFEPITPTYDAQPIQQELMAQLRAIDWFQFEKVVALVYQKHGYVVTRRGGANPDGGVDLIIEKDGKRWAVQCKQWKTWNVGVKAVREFLGALKDSEIENGIFVTLCGYTGEAKQLAEKHRIEIVNEAGLVKMIEDTDIRFDPEALAILHDTRKFCPKCEKEMKLRTAKKGPGAGRQFWGCSNYPRCRFILPIP